MLQVTTPNPSTMADSDTLMPMVTSECGTQAAFDTVCRGSQVTPLTRDAGCQYEQIPVLLTSRPPGLTMPSVIKPSPVKQEPAGALSSTARVSPPSSRDQDTAVFMAAKALQQLQQRPVLSSAGLLRPCGPKELTSTLESGAFTRPPKSRKKQRSVGSGWYSPFPTPLPTPTHDLLLPTSSAHPDPPTDDDGQEDRLQTMTSDNTDNTNNEPEYGVFPLTGTCPINPKASSLVAPVPHKPKPYQSGSIGVGSTKESILQTQLQALQQSSSTLPDTVIGSKVKTEDIGGLDTSLLHNIGVSADTSKTPTSLMSSLLQPQGLMGSLPLTSYALLLDMFHRQQQSAISSSTNSNHLMNRLNQLQALSKQQQTGFTALSSNLGVNGGSNGIVKPTPTTLTNDITAVTTSALSAVPSGLTSSSNGGSLFASGGGILSNSGMFLGRNSPVIPTMLSKQSSSNPFGQKRSLTNNDHCKRDGLDIESLVDSVIDDHMSHDNGRSSYKDHGHHHSSSGLNGTSQKCYRSDDYDMTPPFKRRRRTVFTEKQLQGLEEAYSRSQYLDRESRLELCKKLSLSLHTVVYWFQNKRAISRRRGHSTENNTGNNSMNGGGSGAMTMNTASSVDNLHAGFTSFKASATDSSPSYKHTPPTSPHTNEYVSYNSGSSPVKRSLITGSPRHPSPPSSVSSMSATLTATSAANIAKNVLSVKQMLGATM